MVLKASVTNGAICAVRKARVNTVGRGAWDSYNGVCIRFPIRKGIVAFFTALAGIIVDSAYFAGGGTL